MGNWAARGSCWCIVLAGACSEAPSGSSKYTHGSYLPKTQQLPFRSQQPYTYPMVDHVLGTFP